jgi:hypothetical protein
MENFMGSTDLQQLKSGDAVVDRGRRRQTALSRWQSPLLHCQLQGTFSRYPAPCQTERFQLF